MTTTPISGNGPAWLALPPHESVTGAELITGRFMLLIPNAAPSVLPYHCFLMILEPISANRTQERCYILTHPESVSGDGADRAMADLLDFWDHVNQEDITIVEDVQLGVSTPEYHGGRMCYRFEEPVHRFQNIVIDRMVGSDRGAGRRRGRPGPDVPLVEASVALQEARSLSRGRSRRERSCRRGRQLSGKSSPCVGIVSS